MRALETYATRLFFATSALATAVLAGWIVGSAGFISDDHRLLSIASPVVAGLAIIIAVVPSSRAQERPALAARKTRRGPSAVCSPSERTRSASHIHIQRPPRDYFSPYSTCGRACGTTESNQRTPKPDPERNLLIATPVARPMPKRGLFTRRVFMIGSFWSGLLAAAVGLLGAPLDFMWPRKLEALGGAHVVSAAEVPPEGGEPVRFPNGRFYLSHLAPGQEGSEGGILAIYQKCTHLGCTVPWRPEFMFNDVRGWYRCPCHGSTYTKGAAIRVFGPAPRPLDTMQVEVNDNGDVVVNTGKIMKGGADNPLRAVPYKAANQTGAGSR